MKVKLFISIILCYATWGARAELEVKKTKCSERFEYKDIDVLFPELKKMSSAELLLLQQKISVERQKYYCSILKEYISSNLLSYIEKKNYAKIVDGFEYSCSLAYLTGMTYFFQEKIISLVYKVFNMSGISENNKKLLLSVLKRKILLPTNENFRETVTDPYGTKTVFYANRLLYNYFCIMVMDISLKNLDFEEENRLFSLRIKSISEKLLLENLNFCVMRQGNIKGFYWVIKQPSGFLYANKDIVVYMLESNQVIRTEK